MPASQQQIARLLTDIARQEVALYAREQFEQIDKANSAATGRNVAAIVSVDGRRNAPITAINDKKGTLVFEWELLDTVLLWIWKSLREHSPIVSGAYRRGHILMADDIIVPADGKIPQAQRYVFLNTEPYARKIEVGKTESGRSFVIQVQNRIYERVAKEAHARFDNSASISFGYVDPPRSYALRHDQPSRQFLPGRIYRSPTIRRDRRAGASVPSPAIIITMRAGQSASAGTPQLIARNQPLLLGYANG